MNLELNALGTMINKITTGKITEVNYPWFDKYINLFYEVENEAAQADAKEKYVTLSFTTYDAKYLFLTKFGFNPDATIIKGEDLDKKLE